MGNKSASLASSEDKEAAVIEVDDAQIAMALEADAAEEDEEEEAAAGKDSDDEDYVPNDDENSFLAEERQLKAENRRRAEEEKKKQRHMSAGDKLEQLTNLLQKAAAYTAFLRQRMQEGHPAGTGAGQVKQTGKDGRDPRQPKLLSGGTMRQYQVDGMVWISSLWENGLNGILADEMGLGKTCQTIAFFAHLYGMGVTGPFLVVAPLSTVANWQREFKRFAPSIPTVLYHGSKEERKMIREEVGFERRLKHKSDKSFPVVITSFEVAMNDSVKLQNLKWKYLVVDEGQRLKNKDCRLLRELKTLDTANRLLLSGTPLQNNLTELWSLLNFILPDIFADLTTFQTWFDFDDNLGGEAGADKLIADEMRNKTVSKLHTILDPFLLRRLKSDVELGLPPKHEYVILAPLTATQVKINESVANQTLAEFVQADADFKIDESTGTWEQLTGVNGKATSLNNVLMQLRKCCNHPYLLQAPMDPMGNIIVDERLASSCGKLKLLDRMLGCLKSGGHRVLIFCQMTKMLDLLEDFLELRGYNWDRIDGMTHWSERQPKMDEFNRKDSDGFVFLLSTRAGGLGVNLVGADTVIIYDSDFNPQQDLQAMDRAHRIGQTRPVTVLRMVTINSVEAKIVERANNKRKLELVAIARKRFKVSDKIMHGADIAMLEAAGSKETDEKRSMVRTLTEVRQSLTAVELKEMLRGKALHEVNKDIISDSDLEELLNGRGDKALKKGGKGWDVVNGETGGVL